MISWGAVANGNHLNRDVQYAEGEWEPGLPLYEVPDGIWNDTQFSRNLFDVIDESSRAEIFFQNIAEFDGLTVCLPCDIAWEGPEDPCWHCGQLGEVEVKLRWLDAA